MSIFSESLADANGMSCRGGVSRRVIWHPVGYRQGQAGDLSGRSSWAEVSQRNSQASKCRCATTLRFAVRDTESGMTSQAERKVRVGKVCRFFFLFFF